MGDFCIDILEYFYYNISMKLSERIKNLSKREEPKGYNDKLSPEGWRFVDREFGKANDGFRGEYDYFYDEYNGVRGISFDMNEIRSHAIRNSHGWDLNNVVDNIIHERLKRNGFSFNDFETEGKVQCIENSNHRRRYMQFKPRRSVVGENYY